MKAIESIPLATSYPWADWDDQATRILKKKRKGSGLSFLQSKNLDGNAKDILSTFIEDDGLEPNDTSHLATSIFYSGGSCTPSVAEENSDTSALIRMAQEGQLSLFLSILKHFHQHSVDNSNATVPAKSVVKSCALTVNPNGTPGNVDAKDAILSALQFLSCSASLDGEIKLPLIEVVDINLEPEKRTYRKFGDWHWEDYQKTTALSELELLFNSSPVGREKFVPRFLSDEDEQQLLLKGTIPASAAPRRKGPAPGFRRKSTASPSSAP
mmetsp:Transcript_27639/g.41831  ORF Transcript_27639/g.41831 Transcript_27639/m.41831 type:complete len:269 (-) Transcript_27639:1842-2648(-)